MLKLTFALALVFTSNAPINPWYPPRPGSATQTEYQQWLQQNWPGAIGLDINGNPVFR